MNADLAHEIMLAFADRTGLTGGEQPPVRYLWTDAFAVCNFVGRFREHGDAESLRLALRLVDQTHHVLGRHRADDPRTGWISGLSEADGERHPTCGGLRIGKPLPERRPDEPDDPEGEWNRDGQYFHYLTRWMHALEHVAQASGDATYHRQACELARAACDGFLRRSAAGPRLCWKMSIDLSRPLVASEGQHDALDGLLTCCTLQAASAGDERLDLDPEIRKLASLCRGRSLDTQDPLGLGGLLCDAYRLAQLGGSEAAGQPQLLDALLAASLRGLRVLEAQDAFVGGAPWRLAFRELGLSIGLHAAARMAESGVHRGEVAELLRAIALHWPVAAQIERFWLDPSRRGSRVWLEHRDINDVMLATSLAPGGYLERGKG